MFGEAGSETGLKLVSVELAKKYIKCLIRIFSFAIYFLVELVKMYNKGIIRILLFAIYIYGACFKGYSLLFSRGAKRFRALHAMQCMRKAYKNVGF